MRLITTAIVASAFAAPAFADFATDFGVGVSSGGQLVVEFNFASVEPIPEATAPGFNGWVSDEPGFANFEEAEPDEDIFVMGANADIYFELISTTGDGFEVYDPFFSGPMANGDTFALGGSSFDEHPFWTVNADSPDFDASVFSYDVTFRLIDLGSTGYTATENITVTFTRVPAPAAAGLLLAGAPLVRRRR
ncbi:MAG: hypothetical protein AAGB51_13090 [Planctomycetota bacterium]